MDEIIIVCPVCHTSVRPTDYFCFNCGKNLHPAPPSTTIEKQLMIYIGSFLLPPMGVIWGFPYLRASDTKSKTVGYIAVAITVVTIIIYAVWINKIMSGVSQQMNQVQGLEGF